MTDLETKEKVSQHELIGDNAFVQAAITLYESIGGENATDQLKQEMVKYWSKGDLNIPKALGSDLINLGEKALIAKTPTDCHEVLIKCITVAAQMNQVMHENPKLADLLASHVNK